MAYLIPQPTDQRISLLPYFGSAPSVSGYHLDFLSTTQCFLNPGYARAFSSDFNITFSTNEFNKPEFILIDITTLGSGGCYPNLISNMTLANKTVFGIYVIGDSTGKLETSAIVCTGNNFLPVGYDTFRRVALLYVDTAGLIIKWIQSGFGSDKQYTLADSDPVLTGGTATVATLIDLTAGDGVIPPGHANYVELQAQLTSTTAGDTLSIIPSVLTSSVMAPVKVTAQVATVATVQNAEIVAGIAGNDVHSQTANAAINYLVNNARATANIWVSGFTDSLGNNLF